MAKLNQILGVEKGTKTRVYSELTQIDKQLQKADLLSGISRVYTPKDDDGDKLPPETKHVQVTVHEAIGLIKTKTAELFDITATKEWANTGTDGARADILIDGVALVEKVPVTYLLFLEKQCTDLRTVISRLPVLDPASEWALDTNTGVYKTEPRETVRTVKVPKTLELSPATKEHPAQVQVFTEDVVAGTWATVVFSGAIPATERTTLLDRAEALLNAVKMAREAANDLVVTQQNVGAPLLSFVFGA